jgi:hypothetical protein
MLSRIMIDHAIDHAIDQAHAQAVLTELPIDPAIPTYQTRRHVVW